MFDEHQNHTAPTEAAAPSPVAHVPDADDVLAWWSAPQRLLRVPDVDADRPAARDDQVDRLLVAADRRDAAAADRDVASRGQSPEELARLAGIAREWAARDRDLAAGDRADLVCLLRARAGSPGIPRQR